MTNWQQFAMRSDPWTAIQWAHNVGWTIDAKVGLVCIAAVILVALFGG